VKVISESCTLNLVVHGGGRYATLCIRKNPGCLFIASNCDDIVQLNDAQSCWAGEGAIVGAIKGSTGREPIVAGKPSTFMMDYITEK
jgi:phosphoglycolate phosphatase